MNYTIKRTIHGQADTRLYNIWLGMRDRCSREKNPVYKHYGGRGIIVCAGWRDSFIPFYTWALENGYAQGLTLERLDVNGNYEASNCTWITPAAQKRNMRNNHFVTAFDETKTVIEWAEDARSSISYNGILYRLRKNWSPEDAISMPRTQTGGPK